MEGKPAKGKGKGKGVGKSSDKGAKAGDHKGAKAASDPKTAGEGPCKFFGSAKGCSNESCPFSHAAPNSVPPCSFKQRSGRCDKGEACTFRHVPWSSAEEAKRHYASREKGAVELGTQRYKELHRDIAGAKDSATSSTSGRHGKQGVALAERLNPEHVELEVEKEMQLETYGSAALKIMEKMGYSAGGGLGKDGQGRTKLVGPALELERASQSSMLGIGVHVGNSRATVAERSARLADARAQKHRRLDEGGFVQHNLLSSDESSDGEEAHVKSRDKPLRAIRWAGDASALEGP